MIIVLIYLDLPCIALTATATPHVVDDIIKSLKLKQPIAKFKSSCFRPNLFFDVKLKEMLDDPYQDLKKFAVNALEIRKDEKLDDINWVSVLSAHVLYKFVSL